jgi:hypothetical protein
MLATIGCDNAADDKTDGPNAVAGTNSSSSGSGGSSVLPSGGSDTGGTDGGGMLPAGVALTSTDGWVDMGGNTLGVQGAMFAYADPTSKMGMTEDFVGPNACITGIAAKVDMTSMPCATKMFTPPATDCYGEYWGAAIGLNMNQPIDMTTMMGADPMPYDATALKGFAFEITGAMVPTSLRFKIEDAAGEFCTPSTKPVKLGANTFMFEDLIKECWKPTATAANAASAKAAILKIAWQVVTNDKATIPFDYCVANVRALQ